MRRCLLLVALLVLAGAAWSFAQPLILHVATNGNDAWSGALPDPEAGTTNGPLATLSAALDRARSAAAPTQEVRILLRGGTHWLTAPVTFGPADSGASAAAPRLVAAYGSEHPVLSGGRRITGWTPVTGQPGRWQTLLPAVRDGDWYFRQLFVNGRRQQRARTPNGTNYFRIQGPSSQSNPFQLAYAPGDLRPEWAADGDVEVVAYLAWADIRMQIRAVNDATHVATLAGKPMLNNRETNARYFVENMPDALDTPGEWYLDRHTGVLTCWPDAGDDLTTAEVVAPALTELLVFQGDLPARRWVRHVVLRGLELAHTDWTLGSNGYADIQAAWTIPGAVRAEGASDCAVEACAFRQLGGYGLELGRGCQRWRVVGNEFTDLAAGGIRLGEAEVRPEFYVANSDHVLTDNHIHDIGQVYAPAVGVFVQHSGRNRIAYNHIHHTFYSGISSGWQWGYVTTPARDNVIEFNRLHDIGQYQLSDMGGVYLIGVQYGTVVRNNVIHGVHSSVYGGWGLYLDGGTSEVLVENNLVYRTGHSSCSLSYGRDNVVRNNLFAFGGTDQLKTIRPEPHLGFALTNNLVYFDTGELLAGNWASNNYFLDRNLYFDARPGATSNGLRFAQFTLTEWRQRGQDLHSFITDPLFVAPASNDFRLQTNSPAFALGFQPFDDSLAGVRPTSEWSGPADRFWHAPPAGLDGPIRALLALADGTLFAGGDFSATGDRTAARKRIARWNGAAWEPLGAGLNGTVRTLARLPDGALIAGGDFTGTGDGATSLAHIARWSGAAWEPLGTGLAATVQALAILPGGVLVAGGDFTATDGGSTPLAHVARWTGTAWEALGAGLDGPVSALAVLSDDTLVAGGGFLATAGGETPLPRVARWNSGGWSGFGAGLDGPVRALAALAGGAFVAAGEFTGASAGTPVSPGVIRWNGSAWESLGTGLDGPVRAVAVRPDGQLVAGGDFLQTADGATDLSHLAQWDGATWTAMGTGLSGPALALTVHDGTVVSGGEFTSAGGHGVQALAAWTERPVLELKHGPLNPWTGAFRVTLTAVADSLLSAVDGEFSPNDLEVTNGTVSRCSTTADELAFTVSPTGEEVVTVRVPAGRLRDASGKLNAASATLRVAPADRHWQPLGAGLNSYVHALSLSGDGTVFVGGDFYYSPVGVDPHGQSLNQVARWLGDAWQPIGTGMNIWGDVYSLTWTAAGHLIAGGDFLSAGGSAVNRIAEFRPEWWAWIKLGSQADSGMNATVRATAVLPNGLAVAGGDFTIASGLPRSYIARWNPVGWGQWIPLGSGMNAPVRALAVLTNGDLVAGGDFTAAGSTPARHIARWTGTAWTALGEGLDGPVRALTVLADGSLVAGGDFTTAGTNSAKFLARWDGAIWNAVGSGLDAPVHALALAGNTLLVGGDFETAGGTPARHVAAWDGASWQPLGSGTDGSVRALVAAPDGTVYTGGFFNQAGGGQANNIARWSLAAPDGWPRLSRWWLDENGAHLEFTAHAGQGYSLERSTSLDPDAVWESLLAVEGDGLDYVVDDPLPPAPAHFYRLRLQ